MAQRDSAAMQNEHAWVLVLAAGEGRRLQELTTTASGTVIPKQYCSLLGGPSLLQEALRRGEAIAPCERICAVVADQHRRWWPKHTQSVPDKNVIVQPMNRGTANGILLPLLQILRRDPDARIVVLPSDHYFDNELELAHWLRVASAPAESSEILLLGFEPRSADPQLGYIVPGQMIGSRRWAVGAFVEKPPPARASELVRAGALWNAFIIAADARGLLALYEPQCADLLRRMRDAVDGEGAGNRAGTALKALYEELPDIDFCRDLLENTQQTLRVLAVPQCGWSDLGTPERVAEVLLGGTRARGARRDGAHGSSLSLAAQHVDSRAAR